jgi:hypothetical protein
MFAKTFGLLNTRTTSFGAWLLLLRFSTTFLWAGKFPTDFHPPTPAEARDLLKAICPGDARVLGVNSGCKSCPAFMPEGARYSVSDDVPDLSFVLEGVVYGSFTRPGVQEAVTVLSGCASHVAGLGGSVLLEKAASGWKLESFGGVGHTTECLRYPLKSGRQLLICKIDVGGQGVVSRFLFTVDLSLPERRQADTLLTIEDTVMLCQGDEEIVGLIEDVQLRDLNHDGLPDLAVYVKAARIERDSANDQNCAAGYVVPPGIRVREMDFLFSGDKFKLAPWSVRTMRELNDIFDPFKDRNFHVAHPP